MKKFKYLFEDETEEVFQSNSEKELDLKQLRVILLVFSGLYAVFAVSDWFMAGSYKGMFLFIRFAIVIPIFIVTVILSFKPIFRKINQKLLLLNFLISGLGIASMLIVDPDNTIYYGGMFMIFFSGYLLIKLNYIYTCIGGWIIFVFYFIVFILFNKQINSNFIFSLMFFAGANFIGMIGSYSIEKSKRKNFLSSLIINEYSSELKLKLDDKIKEVNAINFEIVFALAKLAEARDKYTGKHIENVGQYCEIVARYVDEKNFDNIYGSKENYCKIIKVASTLHDIGKVGVNDAILKKNGKLSEFEYGEMKKHSTIGAEILEKIQNQYPSNDFINMGVLITRSHHERYDGLGYSDGLQGKAIPLSARIMALCDTYDALTSKRPYKSAFAHNIAVEIIRNESGRQFDPDIVEIFIRKQELFNEVLANN